VTVHLSLRRRLWGAARHPVLATRVLSWRWRSDAALLVDQVRTMVGAAVPRSGRVLDAAARRSGRRDRSQDVLHQVDLAWRAGHWRAALAAAPPGSARHMRYAGELAAVGPDPVPAGTVAVVGITPVPGRILHVVTNALPDTQAGYTVRTHAIATAQQAIGLDPHVSTRWGYPALDGRFDAAARHMLDGVPYHRLLPKAAIPPRMDQRLARHADALTELTRQLRPAMLHAATPHLNGTAALAVARRCGLPLVYEVRGFLEESWAAGDAARYETDRYQLTRARETAVMLAADAVVTLAATMRDNIVSRGVDPDRIVVVPNAVDAGLLTARPDGAGMRRELGIGPTEFVLGSVSNLTVYEGFGTLLEAAALLRDTGCPVRVLLVGDGTQRAALRELADRLGLGDAVLLPGRVPRDRAPAAVAALDAMCVPRIDAPVSRMVTPLKPVEAMALGVPVIASDLPALAELLAGGRAGALVKPDDPAALADAARRLREDQAWRGDLVAAGRDEVAATRTWQAAARAYRELYAGLNAVL
jgi:glycosyltransferase involved in cell wall biosynthesis